MVSPTPGQVAQMTGILTMKRYKYTTVYIDQALKMGFTLFKVWVISPGTLSLVYILRVQGLLEDFGCFKMLLELFLIKIYFYFYFYFYCEKIIFI